MCECGGSEEIFDNRFNVQLADEDDNSDNDLDDQAV
jgi:hypothetical protein